MRDDREPNASDILAARLGVFDLHGEMWAMRLLMTSLLAVLREKGVMGANQTDEILESISVGIAEKFDRLAEDTPNAAEQWDKMKTHGEALVQMMRKDLTASALPPPKEG